MTETVNAADERAMRSVVPLAIWTLAWVATLAVARFGLPALGEGQPVIGWIVIAINLAVGVGWIVAHARYLRRVDDLQRKILLDALAVSLGAGIVAGCAAVVASDVGLLAVEANIGFLVIVIAVVYLVGVAIGTLRYR